MGNVFKLLCVLSIFLSPSCIGGIFPSEIKYEVTGTTRTALVTYTNEGGGISQENDVSIPWSYTFTSNSGGIATISAQKDGSSGSVTVTIYKNGKVLKSSTSKGEYAIASATGIL